MSNIEIISVDKAMALVGGSFEALTVDPSPLVRKPIKTSFFNSFFNPVPVFSEDDVYQKLKVVSPSLQLPVAKAFHEIKGALDKRLEAKATTTSVHGAMVGTSNQLTSRAVFLHLLVNV